jgi:hypothetical protein
MMSYSLNYDGLALPIKRSNLRWLYIDVLSSGERSAIKFRSIANWIISEELHNWLIENIGSRYETWNYINGSTKESAWGFETEGVDIHFQKSEHAILYKMTW